MQTKIAFNTGEVDEGVSQRADIEQIGRGLLTLENWEVSDLGGVTRRRGLKKVASALSAKSRLFPYIYSFAEGDGLRYIIEVSTNAVRVLDVKGKEIKRWTHSITDPDGVRYTQINKLFILTSTEKPPMVIKYDGVSTWEYEPYTFNPPPWRYNETRDGAIIVSAMEQQDHYSVDFAQVTDAGEKALHDEDMLRCVVWTEQQEARSYANDILSGVSIVKGVPNSANVGGKYAREVDETITYWVCKEDFYEKVYTPGLESPSNYTTNFIKAEDPEDFASAPVVSSIYDALNNITGNHNLTTTEKVDGADTKIIKKNAKFALRTSYWEYWSCIKAYSGKPANVADFNDMPDNYVKGLPCGEALACGGAWSFICYGLWYGEYEVRRNFDGMGISNSEEWESLGVSRSVMGDPTNMNLSGNEREECYLRLFITRSLRMSKNGKDELKAGFPADSCENRLLVEGYRHELILRCHTDGKTSYWSREEPIKVEIGKKKSIRNWSWSAFSPRYGYPLHSAVYNMRLCFAATGTQPQTLWLSQPDDLTNFRVADDDAGAICLTINSVSQNPICWLTKQRNNLLLGTSEAEYVISSNTAGITSTNAVIEEHGHNGSDGITAISTSDKVLYVSRGGERVMEYGFDLQIDGYMSQDLSVFAPHIARLHGGFKRAASTAKPRKQVAFVLGDGQLGLCTYNRIQEVKAWNRWITNGKFLDVCSIPNGNGDDLLFFIVQRGSAVNVEVYATENAYVDEGNNDYVSSLETLPLDNPLENAVVKHTKRSYLVRFGEDYDNERNALTISGDREQYSIPDNPALVLKKGWHEFNVMPSIKYDHYFCLKVRGNRGMSILALQG